MFREASPVLSEAFQRLRTILQQVAKSLKGAAAPALTESREEIRWI